MYVVTVFFDLIEPEHEGFSRPGGFRESVLRNAAASLGEPGCSRFDVAFSPDGLRCLLYEVYDDRAAFDFHLTTPHFKDFDRVSQPLVRNKRSEKFELVANPFSAHA